MAGRLERDTLELLTKEDERYRLRRMGFFRDVRDEAALVASQFPPEEGEDFHQWKSRCLREYYRLKGFGMFCRERLLNPEFEGTVESIFKRHLRNMFETSERTDTDKYLAPDSDTVSFALEPDLFQKLYTLNFSSMPSFGNTAELDRFCQQITSASFPVKEPAVVKGMQDNKNFYWEKFYLKLKPITAAFCYQMSGISGENNTHDIWSDTCISVNSAVVDRRMKEPVTAKDIISYSIGVLKNKNKEIARSRAKSPADIDTLQYKLTAEDEEKYFNNPVTKPENFPSQEKGLANYIDYTDKDSVQGYFIVILYNKEHPLHDILVKGYEDKVQKMFEHYIDGLSYEEIVARHSGAKEGREQVKECARLRQEIKRLKKSLYDRYTKMLEDYR